MHFNKQTYALFTFLKILPGSAIKLKNAKGHWKMECLKPDAAHIIEIKRVMEQYETNVLKIT